MFTTYFAIKALQEERLRSLRGSKTREVLGPKQSAAHTQVVDVSKQESKDIRKSAPGASILSAGIGGRFDINTPE